MFRLICKSATEVDALDLMFNGIMQIDLYCSKRATAAVHNFFLRKKKFNFFFNFQVVF